jgi:transcriptional regulator with XRE-family HTH domain
VLGRRLSMLCYMAGNTPKAKAIGADLRRAREAAGKTQRQVAIDLGWKSHLKLHRAETGERPLPPNDLSDVLVALDAPLALATKLMAMTNNVEDSVWNASGSTEQQRQLDALLELEARATSIVSVSPLLAPGLVQPPEYTRLIMEQGGVPASARRVAERQGRRAATIFRRDPERPPAHLTAFIDEGVLHRSLGNRAVLNQQLDELLELGRLDNVVIRVIPFDAEWSAALEGPFSLIRADEGSAVVHREDRLAGLMLHEPDQVEVYEAALPRLEEVAMSPAATAELIAEVRSPAPREETTT